MSSRRGGGFLCDQKENNLRPFTTQGNLHVPRTMGSRSYSDSDAIQFEDRSLSKLKESDRCSATENLFLESLSLDSPDASDEPGSRQLEREKFLTGLTEVCALLPSIKPVCSLLCRSWYSIPDVGSEMLCHRQCLRLPSSEFGMDKIPCYELIRQVSITCKSGSQPRGPKDYLTFCPCILCITKFGTTYWFRRS